MVAKEVQQATIKDNADNSQDAMKSPNADSQVHVNVPKTFHIIMNIVIYY